jgi:chromosome segregation protein
MRIKQLEIIGLKSFAHRTVLDFPRGISGIVGPNGCGKSNVVDAIRWVLGEQSPRHLRGDSMEDVIFKGNDRVAPAGMAQVSLTFENGPESKSEPDGDLDVSTLPIHFRNLTEITVSRRYFRSGESEYFINKTPCRLKDITELFLGTGVGSKAYAIIEQGRVEQLINAKPEDRRLLIEEAGGTTLFRSRRLAAERKIERTRENLLRVSDVLRELERQIQYMYRMAKKAEQYRALYDEVRHLDLTVSGIQWSQFVAELKTLESELLRLHCEEGSLSGELTRIEHEREGKEGRQAKAEDTLARQREAVAVLQSECRSTAQRIEFLRQEIDERYRRLSKLQSEASAVSEQMSRLEEAIEGDLRLRRQCEDELSVDQARLMTCERDTADAKTAAVEAAERVESVKTAVVDLAAEEAEARNTQLSWSRQREQVLRRWHQLRTEIVTANEHLAAAEHAAAALAADVERLHARLRSAQGEKEDRVERVRALAQRQRERERHVAELEKHLVQSRSRLQYLQDVQRNYEGYHRGVRSILLEDQREEGVLGVVADVLGVPAEHERAVAAALGERLQYVIVREGLDGADAVDRLRRSDAGRGSFIPLAPRQIPLSGPGAASLNGHTRRLLDVVRVEEPFREIAEALLGEVVLVPNLHEGMALWQRNGVYVTIVTPEGDVIDANGVITGGSERPIEEEIVSRQRIVDELVVDIAACEEQLGHAREELEALARELQIENAGLSRLDQDAQILTLRLVGAEKDLERLRDQIPRWADRLLVASIDAEAIGDEERQIVTELDGLDCRRQDVTLRRREIEASLAQFADAAVQASQAFEGLHAELTALRVRVAERQQRLEAIEAAARRLGAQREELVGRNAALSAEEAQTKTEHSDLCEKLEDATRQMTEQEENRMMAELRVPETESALGEATQALQSDDLRCRELRVMIDDLRRKSSQVEVSLAEKRLRMEHLERTVREKYDASISELPLPREDEIVADERELTERLEIARSRLVRMGEVSVGAIEELRELEERASFLRSQKTDLENSIADLERTIQKLNRASKTRFAETFAQVNEKFQEIFPRLFRGGEARLVLTDDGNMLETGVEIVVRPPGKRLDTVTLLSGGEKALVAVSLLFSLFLINPTPFCFLDEVDAPLDDANIGRFTQLLREMSTHSQFIVITHNKRTMQAADVLYGVTMQEPGISKVISIAGH